MTKDTIEVRLALLEQKMTENDRFYQQRYEADQLALQTAHVAVSHRLEILNDHKAEMLEERSMLMPREMALKLIGDAQEKGAMARESMTTRIDSQLHSLEMHVETIGRPNWALMFSSVGVLVVIVSALFVVIGLKIDAAVSPVSIEIVQLKSNAIAQDSRLTERTVNRERQINDLSRQITTLGSETSLANQAYTQFRSIQGVNAERIGKIETSINVNEAERRAGQATLNGQMIELETQFKLVSTVINLMKDDTHQMISALWSKVDPKLLIMPKSYRPEMHERGGAAIVK